MLSVLGDARLTHPPGKSEEVTGEWVGQDVTDWSSVEGTGNRT